MEVPRQVNKGAGGEQQGMLWGYGSTRGEINRDEDVTMGGNSDILREQNGVVKGFLHTLRGAVGDRDHHVPNPYDTITFDKINAVRPRSITANQEIAVKLLNDLELDESTNDSAVCDVAQQGLSIRDVDRQKGEAQRLEHPAADPTKAGAATAGVGPNLDIRSVGDQRVPANEALAPRVAAAHDGRCSPGGSGQPYLNGERVAVQVGKARTDRGGGGKIDDG